MTNFVVYLILLLRLKGSLAKTQQACGFVISVHVRHPRVWHATVCIRCITAPRFLRSEHNTHTMTHMLESTSSRGLGSVLSSLPITHAPLLPYSLILIAHTHTHTNDSVALWARGTEPCLTTFCKPVSELRYDRSEWQAANAALMRKWDS